MALFSFVTSAKNTGTNTVTLTAASNAGDIIICVNGEFGSTLSTSVNDNLGNTYVRLSDGNPMAVYIATNVAAGTATVTFAGGAGGNTSYIVADYTPPKLYTIAGYCRNVEVTATTVLNQYLAKFGTSGTSSEAMLVFGGYNPHTSGTWAVSTGNIRQQTAEGGGETLSLIDLDVASLGAVATTTLTGAASWDPYMVMMIGVAGISGGGGVVFGDFSAGMRG